MKIKYGLKNVNQKDREEFLALLDKMLRDAYLKGYNHGITGEPECQHYFGEDEQTGDLDFCMGCGVAYGQH